MTICFHIWGKGKAPVLLLRDPEITHQSQQDRVSDIGIICLLWNHGWHYSGH
jgi:hypothetical protein